MIGRTHRANRYFVLGTADAETRCSSLNVGRIFIAFDAILVG